MGADLAAQLHEDVPVAPPGLTDTAFGDDRSASTNSTAVARGVGSLKTR